jgi:hypothetical protein
VSYDLAQLPATVEALTGLKFEDLLHQIPGAAHAMKGDGGRPSAPERRESPASKDPG